MNDLREKIIDKFNAIFSARLRAGLTGEKPDDNGMADEIISLCQPQWISVKKELPELYKEVWLYSDNGAIGAGMFMGHNTFSHVNYPVLGQATIVSWQPLPEPPEESK